MNSETLSGSLAVLATAAVVAAAAYYLITALGWEVSTHQVMRILTLSLWIAADHAKAVVVGLALAAAFALRMWRRA